MLSIFILLKRCIGAKNEEEHQNFTSFCLFMGFRALLFYAMVAQRCQGTLLTYSLEIFGNGLLYLVFTTRGKLIRFIISTIFFEITPERNILFGYEFCF